MARNPVTVRAATPEDTAALIEIWTDDARRGFVRSPDESAVAEAATARIAADPDQRLLVAVVDEQVIGAAHLMRVPISPIHAETAIHVSHLRVVPRFRGHGVGRALMAAAVTWAEEKDTVHLLAAASAGSRDANRFMARLGLAQVAVVRGTSVAALRNRLPVEPPAAARIGARSHRSVGQVLAQRRSQRRAQEKTS